METNVTEKLRTRNCQEIESQTSPISNRVAIKLQLYHAKIRGVSKQVPVLRIDTRFAHAPQFWADLWKNEKLACKTFLVFGKKTFRLHGVEKNSYYFMLSPRTNYLCREAATHRPIIATKRVRNSTTFNSKYYLGCLGFKRFLPDWRKQLSSSDMKPFDRALSLILTCACPVVVAKRDWTGRLISETKQFGGKRVYLLEKSLQNVQE